MKFSEEKCLGEDSSLLIICSSIHVKFELKKSSSGWHFLCGSEQAQHMQAHLMA
jgi:hypothetical protein